MDKERSCFVLKMLQKSWLLSQPSPLSVCMAAPSYYGDKQVGRGWRDTVHCGAAARPATCLCHPPTAEEELGCYSAPLFFFYRTFLAGTCKCFLIYTTWRSIPCVQEKKDFALKMCTVAYEPYQKTLWLLILNVKQT